MPSLPHVALLIETSRSYGRGLLDGIRRYIAEHRPWSLYLELRALESKAPPLFLTRRGDGILARTGSQAMADALAATGVPVVELRSTRLSHSFPFVGANNDRIGRLVADHLLERGFRQFGVFELDTEDYFEQRRRVFVDAIRRTGCPVALFRAPGDRERPAEWERQQKRLVEWLRRLPKPVGIMACTDQLGFWLLDACQRSGIRVPDDVAVVGAENDESLCTMSHPPLSSVEFNAERTGYEAAALLDRMMRGARPPKRPLFIDPLGIVTRQSSDVVAMADREIAEAVRLIRTRACEGLTVGDVLREIPISRSSLERRMRAALGRSPKAEITRVQLEHVRRLLLETDLSLDAVAGRSGFPYAQYLCTLFKRRYGTTPREYRRSARAGGRPQSRPARSAVQEGKTR